MADIILNTKRGDDGTSLLVQLTRADGSHPNLTGLALSAIQFHRKNRETGVVISSAASAVVGDPLLAIVRYDPTPTDVLTVKDQEVEVEVTRLDGKKETFPVCDNYFWNIVPDIA